MDLERVFSIQYYEYRSRYKTRFGKRYALEGPTPRFCIGIAGIPSRRRNTRKKRAIISLSPAKLFPLRKSIVSARIDSIEMRSRHDESDIQVVTSPHQREMVYQGSNTQGRLGLSCASFNRGIIATGSDGVIHATLYARHDRYVKLRLQLSDNIRQKSGEKTNEFGRRVSLSLSIPAVLNELIFTCLLFDKA